MNKLAQQTAAEVDEMLLKDILIAILEGRTTLAALRSRDKSPAYFIRKFYHENHEQAGTALSFETIGYENDDGRSYDEVASSIAAREWHEQQSAERGRYSDSLRTFTAPTQFEAAWQDQIGRVQLRAHELGQFLSKEEVEEMLDADVVNT